MAGPKLQDEQSEGEDLGFVEWPWWHEDHVQVFGVTHAAGLGDDQAHCK